MEHAHCFPKGDIAESRQKGAFLLTCARLNQIFTCDLLDGHRHRPTATDVLIMATIAISSFG